MRFFFLFAALVASGLSAALPTTVNSHMIGLRSDDDAAGIAMGVENGNCDNRKTCTAMVMFFQNIKYGGDWYYLQLDESTLNQTPNEGSAICNGVPAHFLSSIKLRPRSDGQKWGCMLYSDPNCQGQRFKGTAMFTNENRDRLGDWNDKAQSMKCFMGGVSGM